jgi:shikimate dehydrogenase
MKGADDGEVLARLVPWSALSAETVAYDLVYNPRETPFVREARRRGLKSEGGLSMLVLQAVRAIEIWLGKTAPYEELLAAAEHALGAHG